MRHQFILATSLLLLAPFAAAPARAYQTSTSAADQLKSPDPDARAKAARELGKSGDFSAVAALNGALIDPDVKVRREVVLALAALHKSAALQPLAAASRDSDPDIRTLALQCMVGYYTGQSPEAGVTGFMKKNAHRAKNLFTSDNARIDPGVTVDPVVLAALQNDLSDTRSIQVQREAARGLGTLMAKQAVPDLVKAAHDSDVDLARQALDSLAKIKDTSAGPRLIDLLDSQGKDVKRDAAVTVGILQCHEAVAKLQLLFQNGSDRKTREKVLQGLAYLGDPVSTPIFTKELWSANKSFRISAAEGLGRTSAKQNVAELQKAATAEKDAEPRLAMQFAITNLGTDDYVNTIIQDLTSKLHADTAQAYLVELSRNHEFLSKLYSYLNSSDATVRRRLAVVLVSVGDKTSIAPLETLSHDSNNDVAAAALRALSATRSRLNSNP
ncbi:MAG TPA: HEAT repeat domain-containing protein [Terriglobia bacterium]|nr:HEAT repeat domain-containing protein [Terriglobia bacterium]